MKSDCFPRQPQSESNVCIQNWNLIVPTPIYHMIHILSLREKKHQKQRRRRKLRGRGSSYHQTSVCMFGGLCTEKEHKLPSDAYAAGAKELTLCHVSQWNICMCAASTVTVCVTLAPGPHLSLHAKAHFMMHFLRVFLLWLAIVTVIQQCSVFKVLPFSLNYFYCFTWAETWHLS